MISGGSYNIILFFLCVHKYMYIFACLYTYANIKTKRNDEVIHKKTMEPTMDKYTSDS